MSNKYSKSYSKSKLKKLIKNKNNKSSTYLYPKLNKLSLLKTDVVQIKAEDLSINLPFLYEDDFSDLLSSRFEILRPVKKDYSFIYTYFIHLLFFAVAVIIPIIFGSPFNKDLENSNFTKPALASSINLNKGKESKIEDPKTIVIPNLALEADITKSKYQDGNWISSDETASYDQESSSLSELRGHTLIFGHARPGLFANLMNITPKDSIYIIGKNGGLYEYKITEIETVDQKDAHKLASLGDHNLTLVTCQGENDKYRFLVKATLQSGYDVKNEGVI